MCLCQQPFDQDQRTDAGLQVIWDWLRESPFPNLRSKLGLPMRIMLPAWSVRWPFCLPHPSWSTSLASSTICRLAVAGYDKVVCWRRLWSSHFLSEIIWIGAPFFYAESLCFKQPSKNEVLCVYSFGLVRFEPGVFDGGPRPTKH